ncbi:hypothetical protein ACHAW6_010931 [Cyclotella cf. meneghiniana]
MKVLPLRMSQRPQQLRQGNGRSQEHAQDVVMPILPMFEVHGRLSDFYKWLGYWLFMTCFIGISDYRKWLSSKQFDLFAGAPFCLNSYMSLAHFKSIDGAIRYTNKPYPEFQDKFYDVCQLIGGFNQHMAGNYFPSWLNCLN